VDSRVHSVHYVINKYNFQTIPILIFYFTENPGISATLFSNPGPFWDTGTRSKNQDHPGKIGTSGKLINKKHHDAMPRPRYHKIS